MFIATLIPNSSFVGTYGEFLGKSNFLLFGYISYFIPFYFIAVEYGFYKDLKRNHFEKLFAILIGIINFLIIQSMIFEVGLFGNLFVNALKPFIGVIGLSLLVITVFILIGLILDIKIDIRNLDKVNKKIIDNIKTNDKKLQKENEEKKENNIDEKVENSEDNEPNIEDYIKDKLKDIYIDSENNNINIQTSKLQKSENTNKDNEKKEEINKIEEVKENLEDKNIDNPVEKIENKNKINEIKIETKNIELENKDSEIKEEINKIEENKEIKIEEVKENLEDKNIDNLEIGNKEIINIKNEESEVKEDKEINLQTLNDTKSIIVNELDENKELLNSIEIGKIDKPKDFQLPLLDFLMTPERKEIQVNEEEIDKKVQLLLNKLRHFKIDGDVVRTYTGPVVTTFEFKPLAHIKVSKILNLQDDLAMALKASTIRIQAPVPGKDVVGIEIPNNEIETIYLREILESDIFKNAKSPLVIALGKDIVGKPFVTDLAKLPHLLIAGTTGSGKSVGINDMILSLLYRNSPDDLKLMMIDPKMLEFSIYNEIPHLLTPVITEPKKAIVGLDNMVKEMDRRYKLMSNARVKNIENYNNKYPEDKLPYIVVIIDELADLMMTGGKDVEFSIARLAQKARASGIHLIVATQRPSVDVVTGLIKANFPSRISFKVGQKIDSKVILDQPGAESLLGRGDMLFTPGSGAVVRLHAPFTTEEEIEKIVEFLKSQRVADYDENFLSESIDDEDSITIEDKDELFEDAKQIILKEGKTSISYLQRRLQIGYNRAANIIEQLQASGFLSEPNARGQREILV